MPTITSATVPGLGKPKPAAPDTTVEKRAWRDANLDQGEKIITSIVNSSGISLASQPSAASTPSVASSGTTVSVASTASAASTATAAMLPFLLDPNLLGQNAEALEYEVWGTHAANGNSKVVEVQLGGTVIATTGSLAANNKAWHIRGKVVRQATQVQVAMNFGGMANDAVIVPAVTALTKDETAALTLSVNASGAAAGDVLINHMVVRLHKLNTVSPVA